MNENYITLSLETHLFFARIMKEHSLFLQAGFPCQNRVWIEEANFFRREFEDLLGEIVAISNDRIQRCVLTSGELVTEFTLPAEKATMHLSGIPINLSLTERELQLSNNVSCDYDYNEQDRTLYLTIRRLNQRTLTLLNGLITFKEKILKEVKKGELYTANYPLLIQHILREARLYHFTIESLLHGRPIPLKALLGTEEFWNQIMMEHALFIRGLLDPSQEALITTANDFALDYKRLLALAREADYCTLSHPFQGQDCLSEQELTEKTLQKTLKYRTFKTAGTEGILKGEIASIILPLLADHVLREANHYIRLLEAYQINS